MIESWLVYLVLFCDWWSVGRLFYGRSSRNGGGFGLLRIVDIHDSGMSNPLSLFRVSGWSCI